ncbi:MAG: nicotinate-nucleotide adenylyltransferase [Bacteroidales bacterium]|nr:nicotinate-nucleotide adenylyltransferase [Bacteroidales bacterium]
MAKLIRHKTGLFFGSFNPIHIGHLVVANYMLEFTDLEEVWFIISPENPLKDKKSLLAGNHRYYMVNLAIENNYRLKASRIEFNMPRPSYTVHTLAYLQDKYPQKQFIVIAGSDILPTFHKWKNYEEILRFFKLYIYPRPETGEHPYRDHPAIQFTKAPMMDISASFIRQSIKKGKNVSFLLPDKIYDYIIDMHFYA